MEWPRRTLDPLAIPVGPCAWDAGMLQEHAEFVRAHPSLVVIGPDLDEAALRRIGPHLHGLPILLGVHEPAFARRLPEWITQRLAWLGREHAELLALWVDDPRALKGGSTMQSLFKLRDRGAIGHVALAHADVREAEWLALHTNARAIVTPYHLEDQAARYRMLAAAEEHGMAVIATGPWEDGRYAPVPAASAAYSLAEGARALGVLSEPLNTLPPFDVEVSWAAYQATHRAPDPLPRGGPPADAG